jgi:hypothetical protein
MVTGLLTTKCRIFFLLSKLRRRIALFFLVFLSLSGAQADVIWFFGNNSTTNLEYQTGQSSGGQGREVDWKDTTIKPTDSHQIGGNREDLSVIQYQPVPPLQTHLLFSFADVFGSGADQIHSNHVVQSAQLWLNVSQVAGAQSITLRGIRPTDSDWTESQASFALKDEALSTAWFGGGDFSGSLLNNYGTIGNPTNTGWVYIDITSAFQDYQRQIISGIALTSSSTPAMEINNFYAHSNQASDPLQAPGLFVTYAIPEPGLLGLMACGLGLLILFTRRSRKLLWPMVAILASGAWLTAEGSQVWLYGGNQAAILEQATGQSSGGIGQSVAWKDAQFKSTADLQIGGGRDIIGVIQRQIAPPLEGFVMLSLNDLFGTTGYRIPPSSEINEAWLWVYVTQTTKQMPIRVAGIRADDRDWTEQTASFLYKENAQLHTWNAGAAEDACITDYGTFAAPEKTGWFKVPVNLAPALNDYRDGRIGGLGLLAPTDATSDIRTFYFCSNEHPQAHRRPGIFANFSEATVTPESQECILSGVSIESGTAQVRLQATQAGNVQMDGRSATYDFGGVWMLDIPMPPDESSQEHFITLANGAGTVTQRVTTTASFASIQNFVLQDQLTRLSWESRPDQYYTLFFTPSLTSPEWTAVLNSESSSGQSEWGTRDWIQDQGFYRIKVLELNVSN